MRSGHFKRKFSHNHDPVNIHILFSENFNRQIVGIKFGIIFIMLAIVKINTFTDWPVEYTYSAVLNENLVIGLKSRHFDEYS